VPDIKATEVALCGTVYVLNNELTGYELSKRARKVSCAFENPLDPAYVINDPVNYA